MAEAEEWNFEVGRGQGGPRGAFFAEAEASCSISTPQVLIEQEDSVSYFDSDIDISSDEDEYE